MDKNLKDELFEMIEGFFDSIDFSYHYEDSDGNVVDYPEKETTKTCDCKIDKHKKFDNNKENDMIVNELKSLLSQKYKEIDELKERNEELVKAGKDVSDKGHKIVEEDLKMKKLLQKQLYCEGYGIVSALKTYVENAREYGMLDDVNFTNPFKQIQKTANDFYISRKPIYC